ncbi:MAG: hypothetical protein ACI9G1_005916 [Pirellulaceae bacterium]|jgi:hypothetical protein
MHKFFLLGALLATSVFVAQAHAGNYYTGGCANGQCGVVSNYQFSSPVTNQFSSPVTNQFSSPVTNQFSSPVTNQYSSSATNGTVVRSTSFNNQPTNYYTTPKASTKSNYSSSRRGLFGRKR